MEDTSILNPVIVLGAGPIGLGAALELARCNIPCILIERNETTSWHPKTRNFNTRTMEIAQGWGQSIYDELRQLDLPPEWKSPIRFMSSIVGRETGSIESKGFLGAGPNWSPVHSVLSSQDMIEPTMLREIKRSPLIDVRFNHELLELVSGDENDANEVQVKVRNKATNEEMTLTGSAMIAADGANSSIRKKMEIDMEGRFKIAHFITCYFYSDVEQYAKNRPGILFFVANKKANGVLQPLDAKGRWLCQIRVSEKQWDIKKFNEARCQKWIQDAVGVKDLPVEVRSVGKWQMNAVVCNQFVKGRVLLMGDAANMFPPSGGLGVNTGLQGMHNGIWKLALLLRGKAGRGLLETYTTERKPVSKEVAEQSYQNALQVVQLSIISRLREKVKFEWLARFIVKIIATLKGLPMEAMTTEKVLKATKRYGNQLGLELGAIYTSSAIVPDGSEPPVLEDAYTDYVPTGRPGHRAPHVWLLKNGKKRISTLDLWSPEFTILTGTKGQQWEETVNQIRNELKLEVDFHIIGTTTLIDEENTFLERYGIQPDGAVLVRPDGYVAWRSIQSSSSKVNLSQALRIILK